MCSLSTQGSCEHWSEVADSVATSPRGSSGRQASCDLIHSYRDRPKSPDLPPSRDVSVPIAVGSVRCSKEKREVCVE